MAKYEVTGELSELIKKIRIENKKTSIDIANAIGKSQAYISKLENSKILTIDEEVLMDIFSAIFGSEEDFNNFLNTNFKSLALKEYKDEEELDKELWFNNFDTVLRQLPISDSFIDDINYRINKIGINYSILCNRINSNEDISDINYNQAYLPRNIWSRIDNSGDMYIKLEIKPEKIKQILEGSIKKANYITLLSITYYLLKIENRVGPEKNQTLFDQATEYLKSNGITRLIEKKPFTTGLRSDNDSSVYNEYDRTNNDILDGIVNELKIASEIDVISVSKMLLKYKKNLHWDAFFMLTLTSLNYDKLKCISHDKRTEFLKEVKSLIDKYIDNHEEIDIIKYDLDL